MADNQILLYQTEDGEARVEVLYQGETLWLSRRDMAELFEVTPQNIGVHIKNIYETGELKPNPTRKDYFRVQNEGGREVSREITHYNLDMTISVGYRVNSIRGTQFRIWATQKLREFIVKGFVLDDDRLADGRSNYFDELQRRVRHIRASEYNLYRKVRDIFMLSRDHNSKSADARKFYSTVQNKLHFAIHGRTAAELIVERANSKKQDMGLTNWRSEDITFDDVIVAKNYLSEDELETLTLLVDQFLSFAELQFRKQQFMYMSGWIKKLDQFIGILNEFPVLDNPGKMSSKYIRSHVKREFQKFNQRRIEDQANSQGDDPIDQ